MKDEIGRLVKLLKKENPNTDDYGIMARNLKTLYEIEKLNSESEKVTREAEKVIQETEQLNSDVKKTFFDLHGDALINATVSIVLTIAVLNKEQFDVIASRAFNWIGKKFI